MNKTNLFKALLLALAGGTITFTACTPDNEPEPQPEPHYNVELFFNAFDYKNFEFDTIRKYASNQYIDTIFMIPDDKRGLFGAFSGLLTDDITAYRNYFQKRFELTPKLRGKGELLFGVGRALPADSLWFVQQGWTVNQSRNKQR